MTVPELLKKGLETYLTLKEEMERALGLKEYAEHLSDIVVILRDVNQYLSENEKAIFEKFNNAHSLAKEGLEKAVLVVAIIRDQCQALRSVLDPLAVGTNEQKMYAALQYFVEFAKSVEKKVEDAVSTLRKASDMLYNVRNDTLSIVETLQRLHEDINSKRRVASARRRRRRRWAVGLAVASGLVLSPIVSGVAAATGIRFTNIQVQKIEKHYTHLRNKIDEYIRGFEVMAMETKEQQERLDAKRRQLDDIVSKFNLTATMSGTKQQNNQLHFDAVLTQVTALVETCEAFLRTNK